MKKKLLFILGMSSLCLNYLQAQSSFGVSEVRISVGSLSERSDEIGSLSDFRKLAPNSNILKPSNTANFDNNFYNNYYPSGGDGLFSIQLGLQNKRPNGKSSRPTYLVGFTHIGGSSVYKTLSKENNYIVDTFVSLQTGEKFYQDSTVFKRINMFYNSAELRFDLGVRFSTNPKLRWSLFGGGMIGLGKLYNSRTNITQSIMKELRTPINTTPSFNTYSINEILDNEQIKNDGGNNISISTPIGVDFRIGKRREFWKKLHLVAELRPGINRRTINNSIDSYTSAFMQQSLGLKVNW
jgi:hypothetical protein